MAIDVASVGSIREVAAADTIGDLVGICRAFIDTVESTILVRVNVWDATPTVTWVNLLYVIGATVFAVENPIAIRVDICKLAGTDSNRC